MAQMHSGICEMGLLPQYQENNLERQRVMGDEITSIHQKSK